MARGKAGPESHRAIDDTLRKVYRETLDEAVPERFMTLLDRLREQGADPGPGPDAAASHGRKPGDTAKGAK